MRRKNLRVKIKVKRDAKQKKSSSRGLPKWSPTLVLASLRQAWLRSAARDAVDFVDMNEPVFIHIDIVAEPHFLLCSSIKTHLSPSLFLRQQSRNKKCTHNTLFLCFAAEPQRWIFVRQSRGYKSSYSTAATKMRSDATPFSLTLYFLNYFFTKSHKIHIQYLNLQYILKQNLNFSPCTSGPGTDHRGHLCPDSRKW